MLGAAAGEGNWAPASKVAGLATLIPDQKFTLKLTSEFTRDPSYLKGSVSFLESTPIGQNEGENQVGLFPVVNLFGHIGDRDLTLHAGVNTRFLPDSSELRVQPSFGVDINIAKINLGPYLVTLDFEARYNTYQHIDLIHGERNSSPGSESSFGLMFNLFEKPTPLKRR